MSTERISDADYRGLAIVAQQGTVTPSSWACTYWHRDNVNVIRRMLAGRILNGWVKRGLLKRRLTFIGSPTHYETVYSITDAGLEVLRAENAKRNCQYVESR